MHQASAHSGQSPHLLGSSGASVEHASELSNLDSMGMGYSFIHSFTHTLIFQYQESEPAVL